MAEEINATGGLALYRKYRPATFAEVRGQDHVTEPLRQALRSGRVNHAYLFSGPRGCGKTSSARILARSLNCVNGPTPDPCGVCDSCVALAPSGPGSIDVIEIDAASHGGVDDARELRERAFYAPVSGRYKIYIIDEAHMVTQQGFNALLKLVEEPPPHLKFIFATTEPEKVIPTIRSRTHHYPFRLMPPSVMSKLLEDILTEEGVSFEPAVIPLVVQAGAGSARDSLSILDQLLAGSDENGIRYDRAVALLGYTDASLLDEIMDAFASSDGAGVFRAVNRVIEGGHEPRRFAIDMLDRFRDLIVLASVPDAISTGLLAVPPDRADALTAQAARWGLAALTRAAEIVSSGLDQMRGATSPRLLLEVMCAQVLLPAAATGERSVLARLERLEAGAVTPPSHAERTGLTPQLPPPPKERRPADEAPSAAREPSAAPSPPARPARSEPRGEVTADALRQDWNSVLEIAKGKSRVAWILLNNASVVALDDGVLTLRFPRAGDVKGFTSSGYEEMLKQVLHAKFGVTVAVRAVSGPDAGPGGRRPSDRGPSGPAPAPGTSPAPPSPPGPAPSTAPASSPGPAPSTAPASSPGPAPSAGSVPGPDPGPGSSPGAESSPGAVPAAGAASAAPAGNPPARTGRRTHSASPSSRSAESPPAEGGRSRPAENDVPFPADEEFDPDDEDMSSPVSGELTGMALVQRELGGEIIGEFEN